MERNLSRLWRVLAVGASLTLALAACGGDGGDGGDGEAGGGGEGETITLGFIGAQTGPNAQLGINISNGAELALEEYNAKGGTQIELTKYDTQGAEDQGPQLARQAVNDEVVGVIGPAFSGESRTGVPVLEEAKIPNISASATNVQLAENGWQYWHRILGNDGVQAPGIVQYMVEKLQVKTVAVTDEASEYGKGLADGVRQGLKDAGVNVAVNESIDAAGSDYSSTVNNIKSANVDAVFHGGYYSEAAKLVKQLRDGGFQGNFVSGDGSLDNQFIEGGGEAAEGAILTCPCNWGTAESDDPQVAEFAQKYEEKFNTPPGTYSTEGYDAATLFINAIEEGNTDAESINEYLKTVDLDGVSKPIQFNEQGELQEAAIYVHEIRDGAVVPLGDVETAIGS